MNDDIFGEENVTSAENPDEAASEELTSTDSVSEASAENVETDTDTGSGASEENAPETIRFPQYQQPAWYQQTPQYQPQVTLVRPQEKFGGKLFIAVLCVICAIVGGITGGIFARMSIKNNTQSEVVTRTQQNETRGYAAETTKKQEITEKPVQPVDEKKEENDPVNSGTGSENNVIPDISHDSVLSAREVYASAVDSVVYVETTVSYGSFYGTATASGSGFIVTDSGYVVTNYHVVQGGSEFKVTTYDNEEYSAKLIGYEQNNDIAVLKIQSDKLSSVTYGDSSSLCVGDDVYVIGNPLGDLTYTLTSGVVSALNRLIRSEDGSVINMFQTDAAINSGNSGGPVFDSHGYVVGIASAKYASSSIEGLSFCIPINDVRHMIDEIINQGYVSGKALLGVSVYTVGNSYSYFYRYTNGISGAKVAAVGAGSAAEKAGIQVGDIITAVDSNSVSSVSELQTYLSACRAGEKSELIILRDNRKISVNVVFDEYTPSSPRTQYSDVYDL